MTRGSTSIGRKVTRVAMLSVGVALLLSTLGATLYEVFSFRARTEAELTVLADVIGANSTAALAFGDRSAATEALATLSADPRVMAATLHDARKTLFAAYTRSDAGAGRPGAKSGQRYGILRPVLLDSARIGTIRLEADLGDVPRRLTRFGVVMVLVAAGSFLTAFLMTSKLQRGISGPILNLSNTASAISTRRDYSLRVDGATDDEVGTLILRFNEMLAQIEQRDRALEEARGELENRVQERTRELEHEVGVRAKAEADLAVQAEELSRSNTDLQQFAYVASHDLQEPLRMVASYLQLLSRRYKGRLDSNADEFIDFAVDGARRMQALIQDLLAYSRVGTHAKTFELLDANLVFARVVENLKVAIEETGARVSHDPLPRMLGDPTQLIQLLQNLIGNAVKFHGARIPEVRVSAATTPDGWEFTVRDNGIGIEPQYAERIFVIFQRLHTREQYGGTGIGLAVCKKIVERHGGRIWLESVPGEGTTFHFTIETAGPALPAGEDSVLARATA
ncbi:MAG: ATP-binding protein [Acidobacteriota bacterium]